MSVELYITRAEFWAQNDDCPITPEEWLAYIARDPELKLDKKHGKHFALWLGKSEYEEPWLDWSHGNISSKWPDTALFKKMLKVAKDLGAKIQDDEGNEYSKPGDWVFSPRNPPAA